MRWLSFGVVAIFLAGEAAAAPEGFTALPAQTQTVELEGQPVEIDYTPAFRAEFGAGSVIVHLHIDGDLGNLQETAPKVLNGRKKHETCGERIRVSNTALSAADVPRLTANVHFERWECAHLEVPEIHGLRVRMVKKTIKTKLVSQSGRICLDLHPRIADDGQTVGLRARVSCARPSSNSILGGIAGILDLERTFRDLAQGELDKALAKASVSVPEDFQPYNPKLDQTAFYRREDGRLGLTAQGQVEIGPAQFALIIARLLD